MKTRLLRFASALVFVMPIAAAALLAQQPAAPPRPVNLQDALPVDAAVRTGTLPNGLTYIIRQNGRPANRVTLRLAVKARSVNEADD